MVLDLSQLNSSAGKGQGSGSGNGSGAGQAAGAGQGPSAGQGGANFFTVTEANVQDVVMKKSAEVPVVVLIGSPRSPASEELKQTLQELAGEGRGTFAVGYLDADATPQVAQLFGVRDLPTTVALGAGQPLTSFVGAQPIDALRQWVNALVQQVGPQLSGPAGGAEDAAENEPPADPRIAAAEDQLACGDVDAAIETYNQVLDDDPDNTPVKQARDSAALIKRARDTEPAADDEIGQALHKADMAVLGGNVEAAFQGIIGAISTAAGDDKETLKQRLFELFDLFEANDPRVLNARTNLASALF